MCGIVGKLNLETGRPPVTAEEMARMLAMIRHRGPDEFGAYVDGQIGLGNARLSIIDLAGGRQPIHNEDGSLWIVYNGEVFNYPELRRELEAAGHRFYTDTDTEVIVHLYEERGADFVTALNGQFALALWDNRRRELMLARDRVGIRPLYYATVAGRLLFASEVKALLADPLLEPRLSLPALAEAFTFWTTLSPHSAFEGIVTLPPGHLLRVRDGRLTLQRYWALDYTVDANAAPLDEAADELRDLLTDAARIRLRADVPVGVYLSGGLDSSTTATLVKQYAGRRLRTFGIAFSDAAYDERDHQAAMVRHLDTEHSQVECAAADVAADFPEVVWHAEMPLLRTSPAPMYRLSGLVHDHDFKVVLTGEGADEILGGYNIFKEARLRRFWARRPDSALRPQLLGQLYPYVGRLAQENPSYLQAFFGQGLADTDDPFYSHRLRWRNTARCQRFFAPEVAAATAGLDPLAGLAAQLPAAFGRWDPLAQAQYLETTIFMSEYLLSSQGDRMAMAHSVEGRYPFLDYRVIEFCGRLPARYKLAGLREKAILKRAMAGLLPDSIVRRPKQPYRAPIASAFLGAGAPDYVRELLSPEAVRTVGLFSPGAVERLYAKAGRGLPLSEGDEMALVGILSTQLLQQRFVADFCPAPPLAREELFVCTGQPAEV